ncbi:molybdopterin-dependent oxidoreductase [Blastomonas sp.]|uniref:molybdopterin-dependent oxidoreductase n=1 Tax=Blastomonas sp. TaxID=1909299 RepID=UPI002635B283|nr:molybdopterin-dependent oxidoreductase [Blastomonas sp.]MDM7957563.1 molybdopterin-dependent oxidoreductase [Blastomonas sp.]
MTDKAPSSILTRRALVGSLGLAAGGLLTGCDALNANPGWRETLRLAETGNMVVQRAMLGREALAREYAPRDIGRSVPANGTRIPADSDYTRQAATGFADWTLAIDGLVEKPTRFALGQIRSMPRQTQITRHDCVEGWSAIGQWTGVNLSVLLDTVAVKPSARYLVFHCADTLRAGPYYESIDMIDARHPQTMMAWALNGELLPIGNGAPLRLRVERQLGYKHAKYVRRIEAVADYRLSYGGGGGYWEDAADYEWYAGI